MNFTSLCTIWSQKFYYSNRKQADISLNWDQRELLAEWVWETRGEVEVWGGMDGKGSRQLLTLKGL